MRSRVSQLASPMGRSVYHCRVGPRLTDPVAPEHAEEPDREVHIQLDEARRIAPLQHSTALVAERQQGALAVWNAERQVANRRQRALDRLQQRVDAGAVR